MDATVSDAIRWRRLRRVALTALLAAASVDCRRAATRSRPDTSRGPLPQIRLTEDSGQAGSYLQLERPELAIAEAAEAPPAGPHQLSNLAAAYLQRARRADRADDAMRALDLAETALLQEPGLQAALFNRAAALELLGLREEARRAYQACAAEPSAAWRAEALRRANELRAPRSGVPEVTPVAVERAFAAALDAAVDGAADAGARLAEAERQARVLEGRGDSWFADACAWLQAVPQPGRAARAAALRRLREARLQRTAGQLARAGELLSEAAPSLEGGPGAGAAVLEEAIQLYSAGRLEDSLAKLETLLARTAERHAGLRANALHMRGLVRTRRGELAAGVRDYEAAGDALQRIGDPVGAAAASQLAATALWYLGERTRAWSRARTAFQMLDRMPPLRRHVALIEGGLMALRDGLAGAAARLARLDAAMAPALPAAARSESQLLLCRALDALGQREASRLALDEAQRVAAGSGDAPLSRRLTAEVWLARAELRGSDPHEALRAASAAIAFFEPASYGFRAARLRLLRGRLLRHTGDEARAAADLEEGVRLFEAQLPAQQDFRARYLDDAGDLYAEWFECERRRGAPPERLLAIAERSRARDLLETRRGEPLGPDAIRRTLPVSIAVLQVVALPERISTYFLTREGLRTAEPRLTPAQVSRAVTALRAAALRGDLEGVKRQGAALYAALLGPFERELEGRVLVVVPDGALSRAPLEALFHERTGRFLAEEHELVVSPSGSSLALQLSRPAPGPVREVLAVHAGAGGGGLPALPQAGREAAEVAALYPGGSVLEGAVLSVRPQLARLEAADAVHFAGHALADDVAPELSRLVLDARTDETLPAQTIRNLRMERARVVFLSACSTAEGPVLRGEGVLSVARAFLLAGARSVVGTSWAVTDDGATRMALLFHRHLAAGEPPSRALSGALRQAIRELPPSVWAAYALYGAPG